MASQEDDNKLESKSNINKEQERNFINVYKKFEYILKNKLEPFSKKIESLIEIWKSLGQCNQQNSDIGYIIQIMDWAKLHTLNIVLTGKWKKFKGDFEAKLLNEVEKTQNELMKISDVFSKKFQKLGDVIRNPWDDPVLANLLHDSNATIGQKEIEFFCVETAYLVSVRLKKLCESQCEDLALNLVTAFMNCYNLSQTQNFSLNATKTHILFCFDIHVALLYRYNRRSDIVALFKKLNLEEGLHLIRRFAKKRVKISKVWRNYPEITFLASQVFVTAAVTRPVDDSGGVLRELLDSWLTFSIEHSMVDKVEVSIRRIIQAATAAQHIYICCEAIHDKFGLKLRTFTIELYIRALTTDMNNLESQKSENDSEKVEETTKRLATGFYNLAEILKDNIQVSRECALTAFSLEPTLARLGKIEDLARASGINVLDTGQIWECKLHPPVAASDDLCWICNSCGKWMCKPSLDLRLTTNFALNEALNFETLGISSQLCDDLAVVLNGPRYHLLSWLLSWKDLHRLCEMYLNDMERTKNLVTDLKFVDIDYSLFASVKREPVEEHSGIERGYERFLYADEKLVNMIEKSNPEPAELPQAKSDPNTLKTLRMFRHNLKRNKPPMAHSVLESVLESNNMFTNSKNIRENWYAAHQTQQRLPDRQNYPHYSGHFSDVFFNHLNNAESRHVTDGAVDFSKHSREALDFRNSTTRKPTLNYEHYQNFGNSASDNFLHNMITYEFARVTSEMKKIKTEYAAENHNAIQRCKTEFINENRTSTLPRIKQECSVIDDRNLTSQRVKPECSTDIRNSQKGKPDFSSDIPRNLTTQSTKLDWTPDTTADNRLLPTQNSKLDNSTTQTTADNWNFPTLKSKLESSVRQMIADNQNLTTQKSKLEIAVTQMIANNRNLATQKSKLETSAAQIAHNRNLSLLKSKLESSGLLSAADDRHLTNKPELPATTSDNRNFTTQKSRTDNFSTQTSPRNLTTQKSTREGPANNHNLQTQKTKAESCAERLMIDNWGLATQRYKTGCSGNKNLTTPEFQSATTTQQGKSDEDWDGPMQRSKSNEKRNSVTQKRSVVKNATLNLVKKKVVAKQTRIKFPDTDALNFEPKPAAPSEMPATEQIKQSNMDSYYKTLNIVQDEIRNRKLLAQARVQAQAKYEGKNIAPSPNMVKEFKTKEDETIAPSKGFPSFDKIPPPPKKLQTKPPETATPEKRPKIQEQKDFLPETVTKEDPKIWKRPKIPGPEVVPEKKLKVDETNTFRAKNGISPSVEKELSKNSIIKSLLTKNDEKTETSVQNENSSKNANCCLPTSNKGAITKTEKKANVITCKTPTQTPSANNNNHKNVAGAKPCCKNQQDSATKNGIGKADIKEQELINQSKTMLLKTLSEEHTPMIVEKSEDTKSSIIKEAVVRLDECGETEKETVDKPKATTNKELKIILHRLSDEVIKSFIPTYANAGLPKKRPIGRPRKVMCCKYRLAASYKSKNPSNPRVFERIDYDKYSLRTLRKHNSNRLKNFSSKNPRRDSDIQKKTGPNKNLKKFDDNKKKPLDDSDKLKKPKKDFSDKDKKPSDKQRNDMNPRVVLERLPLNSNYVRSVLSNVPGLNDYEMIRPSNVNHIVNVVQISGGRSTSTVPVQNTQTSTQITPHIQRIGQPRSDKPEHNSNEIAATTTTTPASTSASKPSTSQPSTLINILSQQIIRPSQSNCVRNRSSPLINILSQQIIRPATTQANKTPANSSQQETQSNTSKVTSTVEQQGQEDAKAATTAKTTGGQGAILQFIRKSTLPKFQQAFGKSVYQNNAESTTEAATTSTETVTNTKTQPKNSSVNIAPLQGGVIYTRQMPVGQTINLIPPGRGQVFRIATSNSDQISLVKDSVIHGKMSALLAAALQGKQKTETQSDGETTEEGTRVTVTRPTLVQNACIVKPVLQIPSNVIRTSPQSNLSSTTLEQLREFDMVYKQIKERSSSTPSEPNTSEASETSQRISVTYLNQGQKYTQLSPVVVVSSYCNLQPAASPALSVTSQGSLSPCVTPAPAAVPKTSKSSKGKTVKNTTTQASKASPIPKPQQKPQEDEHTTQRIFDILAEYAEQLRNSPDLNNKPAPRRRSNPPTNPNQNSKRKKNSSSKKSGQCSSMVSEVDIEDHRTVGSEDSSCGVVQISVQEEESHVQTATTESNDSTSSRQQLILTDAGNNQRNLIIADSSVGEALKMPNTAVLVPGNYIMPVSMVKGGQQIAVVSGGSKILATVPARSGPNMLLFQSFLNQNRNKSGVPTVKYSTIQPISGISSQNLAGVSGQPPVILPPNSQHLTAVALGQPLTLKKIDETDRVNTELLLTISQPRDGNSSESTTQPDSTNNISSTVGNIELEETIIHSDNTSEKVFHTYQKSMTTPIATPVIAQTSCVKEDTAEEQNTTHNSMTLNIPSENNKNEPGKTLERVQSVLVTACTSNGPMLSHTPPRYRKPSESAGTNNEPSNKEEFLHNGEKQNNNEQKQFQANATYFQNKKKNNPPRLDREMHQLCLQRKQAAIERELRLQKSLSEECEDLGVDEPSTSDLFPEADILFDANHSPSFDQSSQDLVKRPPQEIKEENKSGMTLFSDDDNSSSLRTDFLFESVEYQPTGAELEYDQNQQLTNGQSSASNESGSSCEDHTLLQNCASMSDVTLNSPVSPDPYHENTPTLNKYKFKYSNRRKGERHKQASETWTVEVSSSEDTTGSTELGKSSSHSPESCTNKHSHSVSCDEELSDGSYKVVTVAISKSDLLKDDESCEELHCEDDLDCSPSGRGARRSVKKMCSCCNGSQDGGASRKRPSSRPHTPAPHKKAFLNKKR